jgi:hypothetical protein
LPAKVIESGSGYTLSGKPLDPNSGAAMHHCNKKKESVTKPAEGEGEKKEEESSTTTIDSPSKK